MQITVELDVIERPNFVLEPGLSHSLYTKHWNADVVFDDRNFLGRNQVPTVPVSHPQINTPKFLDGPNVFVDRNKWSGIASRDPQIISSHSPSSSSCCYGVRC